MTNWITETSALWVSIKPYNHEACHLMYLVCYAH